MAADYVFDDEWDVAAPQAQVFEALADARTYPEWWEPVLEVQAEGPPELGWEARQRAKVALPYKLSTVSKITRLAPPNKVEFDIDGDLRGHGAWTLTPRDEVVHVRFDWIVHADKPLLRVLTPVFRPLFRWNHAVAVKAAREGLEPYARSKAAAQQS